MNQEFILANVQWSFQKFTVATMTWMALMWYICHKWPWICSTGRKHFHVLLSCMTYHRVCNYINTTGSTSGTGTVNTSGAPAITPGFYRDLCYAIFSFMCMFCRSFFCPFLLFLLTIVVSGLFRFMDSDYPFSIFKLFLHSWYILQFGKDISVCLFYIILKNDNGQY